MEKLFEDLDFNKTTHIPGIVWKRPHEIVNNPSFIDDDINIDDISQGQLSNCWLIATLNILIHDWNNFLNLLPTISYGFPTISIGCRTISNCFFQ